MRLAELTEVLQDGLSGLVDHPLRTGLTGLGIVFGVAAVIAMLSIGEGAQREAQQLISLLGLHQVLVESVLIEGDNEDAIEARKASLGLRVEDGKVLLGAVPQLEAVGGRKELKIEDLLPRIDDPTQLATEGVDPGFLVAAGMEQIGGRLLLPADNHEQAAVCVLGIGAARLLFGSCGRGGRAGAPRPGLARCRGGGATAHVPESTRGRPGVRGPEPPDLHPPGDVPGSIRNGGHARRASPP